MSSSVTAFGLRLETEVAVPGALPSPAHAGRAEIAVVLGPARLAGVALRTDPPYAWDGRELLFAAPGARYLCGDRRVIVEPHEGTGAEEVSGLLAATALPALLWTLGYPVLHACAAVAPCGESAVAIAGASGAGKTTVLRALLDAGWAIVGDDTLRLEVTAAGGVSCSGLPTTLLLRSGTVEERHELLVPTSQARSEAALGAVFVLASRTTSAPTLERLSGGRALGALLARRHRPRVPRLLGTESALLGRMAEIAGRVRVYDWCRQDGTSALTAMELEALNDASRGAAK